MARGAQKEQSRQKAQKEAAKRAGKGSQLGARAAGLQIKCSKCFIAIANYNLLKQHMEAKHPKDPIPPESDFAAK
ncbi:C2H2-type zinc finger transcription factor [Mucor lusitanicus]|uniref:C2H2-type zinc finger transcription factor n=2 Tax=Mucor circinelloides f. lusitanicus TaxID=29924 RepID=A0A168LU36_MUCCL|nr:C2H2-type zinc finger transcription factor [Mucor lusitanicus]OAD03957.1 C2H2-type zinc finger transcription factor [Mucor lusitanicus CBS 277.49]